MNTEQPVSLIAEVALLSPPFVTLSYSLPKVFVPEFWKVGQRVVLPLGSGVRIGVLLALKPQTEITNNSQTKDIVLKDLIWSLDKKSFFSESYLRVLIQLSHRLFLPIGQILASVLPIGLRSNQLKLCVFNGQKPKKYTLKELRFFDEETYRKLAELWASGQGGIIERNINTLENELCELCVDPPWAVRPSAKRQIALLELLWENGALNRKIIQDKLGAEANESLKRLSELGFVKVRPAQGEEAEADEIQKIWEKVPLNEEVSAFELTNAQQEVVDKLKDSLDTHQRSSHLLHGITGSGKTVVYLELLKHCLAQGRSVILLAPEVALAIKLKNDLQKRFPQQKIILSHGYQTPTLRESIFRQVSEAQEALVIIGTRSSLFLPLKNPGLIILDEEHDASFKQDEGLVYQAKELAYAIVQEYNAMLLLGSATPDIKSFQATKQGRLTLHSLPERVGGGTLPQVELVDIRHLTPTDGILAKPSQEALLETINKGEQAVILLNRRGYAPLIYCMQCSEPIKCPHCDIALTYHKARERVVCHYCGYNYAFPAPCPTCKSLNFVPFGEGTEKLEESLSGILPPDVKILRLDRDNARRAGRMEEILAAFARKEAQVLVGTQMLSKGHHFPDVTLAIVADADLGLNLPDYRATERSFQLFVQSAGRAGRGSKAGKVLIQTRNLNHYCWDYVKSTDFSGFFEVELQKRKRMKYPPFTNLALIRLSFPVEWKEGYKAMELFAEIYKKEAETLDVAVLGPAPAPLSMLRGRRRYNCLLKAQNWQHIRRIFQVGLQSNPFKDKIRMHLDLDPVNMM
ncbi:replication restart helicase PriA [Desulfovibrio litoralis]|uniref:replication restart helicase PriA n=1 Tax=Desulfovibrio litoralis TaxID=466107 RepID=UPI0009326AEE|nr:primosomal protein N' [Desulfovibrio litoralis]